MARRRRDRFDYVIANFDAGLVLFLALGAIAVYLLFR